MYQRTLFEGQLFSLTALFKLMFNLFYGYTVYFAMCSSLTAGNKSC